MANQVDPATVGGAAASGATAHGAVATAQGGAAAHGHDAGPGSLATATGTAQVGPFPPFHGRRVSWVAVSVIMAGFLIGGLSLVFGHHGPIWWLFWTGSAVAVLGLLMTIATNTFEDWY